MWASTLAGLAFGNAGVHLPHAMGYAVARGEIPHGISVVASAPAAFRYTASAAPERHREAAGWLGGDDLASALEAMMRDTGVPTGLRDLGYGAGDIDRLVAGTAAQRRLLDNAPCPIHEPELHHVFSGALA
jgi:alcohol dehydrogenase class IV